jgi:hypothetical protein
MKVFETSDDRQKEDAACARLASHWRGDIETTEQFYNYDRRLIENGQRKALVEIKCRSYSIDYFREHQYMIGQIKVDRLVRLCDVQRITPLIMVACIDDDFLLDLRDKHYWVQMRRVNDRATTHAGVIMRDEAMCFFAPHRFLPLSAIDTLIA